MTHPGNKSQFFFPQFYVLAGLAICVFLGVPRSLAQSPSDPAVPSTPATTTPAPQTPDSETPAKPPAKPKHVITNDDLPSNSPSGATAKDGKIMPGPSRLVDCDASCEHAARNYLGYDSDNEGLWRSQIDKARADLLADNEWRGLLNQAIAQTNYYCNFLAQQSQKTAPSSNDYRAQVQRSRNSEYFEYTQRNLQASIEGTMNRMQQRIQEVQVLSPVRAAMMYVQADRIFERDCDSAGSR